MSNLLPVVFSNLRIPHPQLNPAEQPSNLWRVLENLDKGNEEDTLSITLLAGQSFPLTQLLTSLLPQTTELPPFIPEVNLDDINLRCNVDQDTFSLTGTVKSVCKIGWGISALTANNIDVAIERRIPVDEQEAKLDVSIKIASDFALEITTGLAFQHYDLSFSYNEGKAWSAEGWLYSQLLETVYPLSLSLARDEAKMLWTLQLTGEAEGGKPPFVIAGVCDLAVPKLSVAITRNEQDWGLTVIADGVLSIELPQHHEFTGQLALYIEQSAMQLEFAIDNGDIFMPLSIPNENIILVCGLRKLAVAASNAEAAWCIAIAAEAGFQNLPKPYANVFPSSVAAIVLLSDEGLQLSSSRFFNPIGIALPTVDIERLHLELGTLLLDANNLTVTLTKEQLSVAIDLGVGIPAEWNRLFGVDSASPIFYEYQYNDQHELLLDSLRRVRLMFDNHGLSAELLDSPFKCLHFNQVDGHSVAKIDLGIAGEFGLQLPKFAYDGHKFTANGGIKVTRPLQIPLEPIKKMLTVQGLQHIASKLPDLLSVNDINVMNADGSLHIEQLSTLLQNTTGFALSNEVEQFLTQLQGKINRLPADLLAYFRFIVPTEFNFDLAISVDGGADIKIKTAEDTPLCFLLPIGPQLIGIRLRSFTFGELLSGSLFLLAADVEIDIFDPLQLCLAMLPAEKLGLKKLADSHSLRQRLYLQDFSALIVYQTAVPIPIPAFYKKIGIEVLTIDGSRLESEFRFPAPEFNADEARNLFQQLFNFFTDPDYLLDTSAPLQLDLRYTIGKHWLQLPNWVSDTPIIFGKQDDGVTLSAYHSIATLMNAVKSFSPALLVTTIPFDQRVGDLQFEFLGVQSHTRWVCTTHEELNKLSDSQLPSLSQQQVVTLVNSLSQLDQVSDKAASGLIFYFDTDTKLGQFDTHIQGCGTDLTRLNTIMLEGSFQNDLLAWIKQSLTEQIIAANNSDKQHLNHAHQQLNEAQDKLSTLHDTIEQQRQFVQSERNTAQNSLAALQVDVDHAQTQVNKINDQIQQHEDEFNALPTWNWHILIASKVRDWLWYIIKRIALLMTRNSATAALKMAHSALTLSQDMLATPVDLDPRVSLALASYEIAVGFLDECQQSINTLEQSLEAFKEVGVFLVNTGTDALIDVEQITFKGSLDVLRGAELPVSIRLCFMGKQSTLNLIFDLDEPNKLIESLFKGLVY